MVAVPAALAVAHYLLSLALAAIVPLGRAAMANVERESLTYSNPSSCGLRADGPVDFPPVGPKNLVRLAEDSLRVYSTLRRLNPWYGAVAADREYISSVSGLISTSRDATSPTSLSSTEAAALTEIFCEVSFLVMPPLSL